jgi:hypothetical protein
MDIIKLRAVQDRRQCEPDAPEGCNESGEYVARILNMESGGAAMGSGWMVDKIHQERKTAEKYAGKWIKKIIINL